MKTNSKQYTGTVRAHPKGFGFVELDDKSDSFFIPPPLMQTLLSGDQISFEAQEGPLPEQTTVSAVELTHRPESFWLGELSGLEGVKLAFTPDDAVNCEMLLPRNTPGKAGDVIQVKVAEGTPAGNSISVTFVANLGPRNDRDFDTRYAIAKYRLPQDWSQEALSEANQIAKSLETPDVHSAIDLRELPFVTIDGASTKDIDDAICVNQVSSKEFLLYIGIADVSRFVRQGGALDLEAQARGTSVYFPDKVLPMLPPVLSNGVCSLNPGADRYAFVAELSVLNGELVRQLFYPAVIRSRAKMTYDGVTSYKEGSTELKALLPDSLAAPEVLAVEQSLLGLVNFYKEMGPSRAIRGFHESREAEPVLNIEADGRYGLRWEKPTVAHEMVEECMLLANQAAAKEMENRGGHKLFRHHVGVDPLKWADTREWLEGLGIYAPTDPALPDLKAVLTGSKGASHEESIAWRVRRSLTFAVYSTLSPGHYSLEFEAYTHFTSPIRRYADLTVHRILRGEVPAELEVLAEHCSVASRRADLATRDVMDRVKKRNLWRAAKGSELTGQIAVSNRNGLKVVVGPWETVVLVSQWGNLKAMGLRWDKPSEEWKLGLNSLQLGATVRVRPTVLEQSKNSLEVQGVLIGFGGIVPMKTGRAA
jgi:ribonuclease R